jgi:bacteriocin-like protein
MQPERQEENKMNTNRAELSMKELEQITGGNFDPLGPSKKAAKTVSDLPHKAVEIVEKIWDTIFG